MGLQAVSAENRPVVRHDESNESNEGLMASFSPPHSARHTRTAAKQEARTDGGNFDGIFCRDASRSLKHPKQVRPRELGNAATSPPCTLPVSPLFDCLSIEPGPFESCDPV